MYAQLHIAHNMYGYANYALYVYVLYVYACMCMHVCLFMYESACMYVYACMRMHVCVCMYACPLKIKISSLQSLLP